MTLNDLYLKIKIKQPQLLYISGKTCVGKSTFAKRLQDTLGYEIIELDKIVLDSVIRPQGITDEGAVFVEVYRNSDRRDLIAPFVAATTRLISEKQTQHKPIVIDGAVANVATLWEICGGHPELMFVYFHPKNLATYQRNLTSRFVLSQPRYNAGLPKRFWELIDDDEFALFCKTRIVTPKLEQSIARYAISSQAESETRLETFKKKFDQMIVINI